LPEQTAQFLQHLLRTGLHELDVGPELLVGFPDLLSL
jgi:hypothetical protein